jgi:TRAP-type transport system periplasmic protein
MQRLTLRPGLLPRAVFAALLAVLFASLWSAPAGAQSSRSFKIGYLLSKDSQLGAGATAFGDALANATNGRLRLEHFPNAALGGEVEMLKALRLGTLDMAFITGAALSNVVPETGVFNIPFMFRNVEHARAVLDGPIGKSHLEKFNAKGLVALAWGENGLRHITNSRHEIRTPGDLKGLRLRLPQSEVMLIGFKALGADPAPLPFPQLFAALRAGQFDGQENPIATILAAKLAEVQKFLTLSGHVYDPAVFLVSADVMNELSEEDRRAIAEAAVAGAQASRRAASEAEEEGIAALAQAGMKVTPVDPKSFASVMAGAMPQYRKLFGAEIIDKIQRSSRGGS